MLTDRPVLAETAAKNRQEGDTRLWGTAVTTRPFALPTHLADPLERLRAAHAQNTAVKADVAARPVQLEDWFDFVPPFLLRPMLRLTRLAAQRVNGGVIVSNVKGPREKRYIGGMGIENFISCGHLKFAAGVNITVWSYNKLLNFAVYGCSRTLPDAESVHSGSSRHSTSCAQRQAISPTTGPIHQSTLNLHRVRSAAMPEL